jgi:hypothetical protein
MARRPAALIGGALALALVIGACGAQAIPQPAVPEGLEVAPDADRVDMAMPTFSRPTEITNPLFPVSSQASVLLLGQVDDQAFRTEVTLLPETRIIEWQGRQVEVAVSQYLAYLDGQIHEVAYDLYAQADDGSVWYFGEDVFNFADGAIVDTHGTWIAGKDGPAAMIMPADPQVGDVYRPENIPGLVFEEVTVKAVDETLDGPLGPIEGGLLIEELHMDGSTEEKSFAPGYGEFYTAGGGDVEALALAVPTDAASEPIPDELVRLESGAADAFEATQSEDWDAARATVEEMAAAWESYRAGGVPRLIEPELDEALGRLAEAVDGEEADAAGHAAIDVAQWGLDLQLRHRPVAEVDMGRFDLWAGRLLLDAEAEEEAAVNGDLFALDYVRDRIRHTLDAAAVTRLNSTLEELQGAVGDGDFAAMAEIADQLRGIAGE